MSEGMQFRVNAVPAGQGSKRHMGRGILIDDNRPALKSWREAVRSEAQRAMELGAEPLLTGPIRLRVIAIMPRPKAHFRTGKHADKLRPDAPMYVASTPDLDKVARSIGDALTDAGAWHDDRQVAHLDIEQRYAAPGEAPGALITITPLY